MCGRQSERPARSLDRSPPVAEPGDSGLSQPQRLACERILLEFPSRGKCTRDLPPASELLLGRVVGTPAVLSAKCLCLCRATPSRKEGRGRALCCAESLGGRSPLGGRRSLLPAQLGKGKRG